MNVPIGDWQFWVVTLIAVGGAWLLLRPIIGKRDDDGCTTCAPTRPERTSLTVEGENVARKK
ncbi:MAG: hypothetical protein ACYTF9_02575 [Planctomycetota bacterium]|jgi:hypothetical protein